MQEGRLALAVRRAGRPLAVISLLAAALLPVLGCQPTSTRSAVDPAPQARNDPTTAGFLSDQKLRGKVVLIEFGQVGCVVSNAGLDQMNRLNRAKEIEDLAYLRVEVSKDAPAVDRYYKGKSLSFPVYRDPDGAVAGAFDAKVIPLFVLVDKYGHVRYRGPMPDANKLSNYTTTLLAEEADPGPNAPQFGEVRLAIKELLDSTKLPDMQGTVRPMREYMGAKGLLAVFVDTSCPFAGSAVTDMATVTETLRKLQITSLIVNISDPKDDVLAHYGILKTGALFVYDVTRETQQKWQIDSVPTVMLISPDGAAGYRGKATWPKLATAVEQQLKLAPGSVSFTVQGTEYG
jgi:hypothetical protein